jgi:hypothetical protein
LKLNVELGLMCYIVVKFVKMKKLLWMIHCFDALLSHNICRLKLWLRFQSLSWFLKYSLE